jgi:hypothetical protein
VSEIGHSDHRTAERILTWLSIAGTLVLLGVAYGRLNEQLENNRNADVDRNRKIERIEDRQGAIEGDRRIEDKIAALTAEVAALRAEFRANSARKGRQQ